ncbi:MAG: TatD family hydrolase [Planctomycetaceae bacterium]|nr:TatD family hydrolase [Planctomycetales bacterium]MCB9921739.1 TatD family hydrolase [Planctomycetaceae bacterium]
MRLFDTHCHLDDEQFDSDRQAVLSRAADAGVETILAVGTTVGSSVQSVGLAAQYKSVFAAVGIQPNYCGEAAPQDWDQIVELSGAPKVVALGETGLDRYWDHTPFDVQEDYFDRHIRLSQTRDLPFIVHLRDCEADILRMLREARARGPLQGVMHSYTGSAAGAFECIELGLYISFAGMVTYKKSDELREVAKVIPDDRILIETDSPYLSPHPKRGQRPNEPALVIHTAGCLAETRGTSLESFAELTTRNASRLFKLRR